MRAIAPSLLALLWLPLLAGGCDSCRAESIANRARDSHLQGERETWVAEQDPQRVWTEARALLAEQGIEIEDAAQPLDTTHYSPWRSLNGGRRSRYSLRVQKAGPQRALLRIHEVLEDEPGSTAEREPSRSRRQDLEWEVYERVQPSRAADTLTEAQRRGQRAYDRQVMLGCGCDQGEARPSIGATVALPLLPRLR